MKKEVCLNELLQELVDKYVTHYKTDLAIDLKELSDKKYGNDFYMYFRECGTELMRKDRVCISQSGENVTALYYRNSNIKAYRVTVTRRENDTIYGFISKMDLKKFIEMIERNSKKMLGAKVQIVTHDDKVYENTSYNIGNFYYDTLNTLKMNVEKVKSYEILEYLV